MDTKTIDITYTHNVYVIIYNVPMLAISILFPRRQRVISAFVFEITYKQKSIGIQNSYIFCNLCEILNGKNVMNAIRYYIYISLNPS